MLFISHCALSFSLPNVYRILFVCLWTCLLLSFFTASIIAIHLSLRFKGKFGLWLPNLDGATMATASVAAAAAERFRQMCYCVCVLLQSHVYSIAFSQSFSMANSSLAWMMHTPNSPQPRRRSSIFNLCGRCWLAGWLTVWPTDWLTRSGSIMALVSTQHQSSSLDNESHQVQWNLHRSASKCPLEWAGKPWIRDCVSTRACLPVTHPTSGSKCKFYI